MATPTGMHQPSPDLFFRTITAFQQTAALKAALELDLFTALAEGPQDAANIATRVDATERGVRILCDYLVVTGFLTKDGARYATTPDSQLFLSKNSPAYCGAAARFLADTEVMPSYWDLANAVRKGGTTMPGEGTVEAENPLWIEFAEAMAATTGVAAPAIVAKLDLPKDKPSKILDIAASHGMFGISVAKQYPQSRIVALDWASVLRVCQRNAERFGVSDRITLLPGDAFTVDLGTDYDAVLLTNLLHHFDMPTCEKLLKRVAAALKPGGQAVLLEFVPNEDRISPPLSAMFPLVMLANTRSGDAYTFSQYQQMLANSGFRDSELHQMNPGFQQLVIARKM